MAVEQLFQRALQCVGGLGLEKTGQRERPGHALYPLPSCCYTSPAGLSNTAIPCLTGRGQGKPPPLISHV